MSPVQEKSFNQHPSNGWRVSFWMHGERGCRKGIANFPRRIKRKKAKKDDGPGAVSPSVAVRARWSPEPGRIVACLRNPESRLVENRHGPGAGWPWRTLLLHSHLRYGALLRAFCFPRCSRFRRQVISLIVRVSRAPSARENGFFHYERATNNQLARSARNSFQVTDVVVHGYCFSLP